MSALRRHCRRLRTVLVLLVLGMVVNPTLAAVGELHGIEHAAMADHADVHAHAHPDDPGHHHDHDRHGDGSDSGHASGGHGLMHQGGSLSVTMPEEALSVSDVALCEPLLPEFRRLHFSGDAPDLPFRPPIA
jgi:hypothetical protein